MAAVSISAQTAESDSTEVMLQPPQDTLQPLQVEHQPPQKAYKQPSKALLFFYRSGQWVDNYLLHNVDTAYIGLPEHSWRVAFTTGMSGVNSTLHSSSFIEEYNFPLKVSMLNRMTPSVDIGFNIGFRGFGFGYSWDALHTYARKLSFGFGSKYIGIDFTHQTSANIQTRFAINDVLIPYFDAKNAVTITNTNLNIWYALNAAHYSHQAAMKQSYIQRKSAGSLMLHLSYMASKIAFRDTIMIEEASMPTLPAMMSGVNSITTRQVAVGLGYGINYTPNHGKVVLHAAAAAMLVCYSINHIGYYMDDSIQTDLPGEALFALHPSYPVHVTGNVRAAVSWEINKWVHMSAWATGDNIRFRSEKALNNNELFLTNWNWKVQLVVAVRLGAGRDRVQHALGHPEIKNDHKNHDRLPLWLTDFFWGPK